MYKRILIIIFLCGVFLTFNRLVYADLYMPTTPECGVNERYFPFPIGLLIDPAKYQHIKHVQKDGFWPQESYCVSLKEYCQKNTCDLSLVVETLYFSKNLLIVSLPYNLIVNMGIVLLILIISKTPRKFILRFGSFAKIILLTILGYFADLIALSLATTIIRFKCTMGGVGCGQVWHKSGFSEQITAPLSLATLAIAVPLIFFLVSFNFYYFYSPIISNAKQKRFLYSIIFGVFSNPLWYFLARIILIIRPL